MVVDKGWPAVKKYMAHIKRAAEKITRNTLSKLADGTYAFKDSLDDGAQISISIIITNDQMSIDFTGSAAVNLNCLNANKAIVESAVIYCLRCIIDEDIPLNSGVMKPVTIILPQGMLNPPNYKDPCQHAAVAGGNVEISQRIVDVIFGALDIVAASQGTMNNVVFGNDSFSYYETVCGGTGAGPNFSGADAVHSHMTNTRLTDIEILEKQFPVRVRRFYIRKDSGGLGEFSGGNGIVREIEFLAAVDVSLLTQRRVKPPFGLNGGDPGKVGENYLLRKGRNKPEPLCSLAEFSADIGDVLILKTPGGGGYGRAK
jgi:5-oxoprolinase (ATP-hydrolysing)